MQGVVLFSTYVWQKQQWKLFATYSVRGCVIVSGLPVDQECQAEMRTFAIELFENYKISPIVVQKCEVEIKSHCQDVIGKHDDGDMMDCLMTLAATNDSLSPGCYNAVWLRNLLYWYWKSLFCLCSFSYFSLSTFKILILELRR